MKINKADKGASGPLKRMLFHYKRGKGHLFRYAWNRVRWFIYPKLKWHGSYPDHVDFELSAACNMKCPMCYTTTERFKKEVPHVNLDFDIFKKAIDECASNGVFSIRLSWRGEPLLNKHFMDMIRYAKNAGIKEVDSLTNALRLTPEMFEELVDLGVDWLTISFDGTGETYEKIRKPAKYNEMVEKIRIFSEIKKRKNSVKPVVRIQGIWPAIEENPEEYFNVFEPIVDEVSVNSLLDYLHKDEDIEYIQEFTCPVPFQRLVIGADGRAFMCINDELGEETIGSLKVQTVKQIWNSPAMIRIRDIHKQHRGYKELEPCKKCYQPREIEMEPIQVGHRTIWLEQLKGRINQVGK